MAMERAFLLVLLSVSIVVDCFAQSTYYITPTPDTPCPGHQEPCHTLSEYAVNGYLNNLPINATMKFLPGNHTLETTIILANLTSLAVLGDSSSLPEVTSRIVCTWPAGFAFTDITELHITAVAFISCGHSDVGALNITSVVHAYISLCVFDSNYVRNTDRFGGAIAAHGGVLILTTNVFQDNHAYQGGAIYAQHSTLSLTGNVFQNNFARNAGGAITAANVTLDLAANVFQGNHAYYGTGGAILTHFGNLSLTNNTFQDNTAYEGGAILATGHDTLRLSTNVFQNNFAYYAGGAITAVNSSLDLTANEFQHNFALQGGVVVSVGNDTLRLTANVFQGNSAYLGGAIMSYNGNLSVTNNIFQNNFAKSFGGAIAAHGGTLDLIANVFQNNSAQQEGGAIDAQYEILSLTRNTFQGNSANRGGAIIAYFGNLGVTNNTFQNNFAESLGGAITLQGVTLDLITNVFQNNSAQQGGGAIDVQYEILNLTRNTFQNHFTESLGRAITLHGVTLDPTTNVFQDNSAQQGGAIKAQYINFGRLISNKFQSNFAEEVGGAIIAEYATLVLTANVFQDNSALQGGAITANNASLSLTRNTFQNNFAKGNHTYRLGGAIVTQFGILNLTNNTFQDNSAYRGGAIAASKGSLNLTMNRFQDNSAYEGGAIVTANGGTLSLTMNRFLNNFAKGFGGAVNTNGGTLNLSTNVFQGNSAYQGGAIDSQNKILSLINNTFKNNSAERLGGAVAATGATFIFTTSLFQGNSANQGGAVDTWNSTLILTTNTFQDNSAEEGGGAVVGYNATLILTANKFQNNSADYAGGALYAMNSFLHLTTNVLENNSAVEFGGAILVDGDTTVNLTTNDFHGNSARQGGAVDIDNGIVSLTNNTFRNNIAENGNGGALAVSDNCTIILTTSTFQGNSAYQGGAIDTHGGTFKAISNTFQKNRAQVGGAIFAIYSGTRSFFNNTFLSNSADLGGAISAMIGTFSLRSNAFQNNSAYFGGALYAFLSAVILMGSDFHENSAFSRGGALAAYLSNLNLTASTYEDNTAVIVATRNAAVLDRQLTATKKVTISGNTATYGGGLYVVNTTVHGSMILTENSAIEGGAISASRGSFFLNNTTTIVSNSARIGGGLVLSEDSKLYLPPDTTIRFINNTAQETGGAIHAEAIYQTELCLSQARLGVRYMTDCFFQLELSNTPLQAMTSTSELQRYVQSLNISMDFDNNSAKDAGGDFFGGLVDTCLLTYIRQFNAIYNTPYSGVVFDVITAGEETPDVTSAPLRLCICKDELQNCNITHYSQSVYPGGTVEVPVIALGQRDHSTIATIYVIEISKKMALKSLEYTQSISKGCSTLRYTIYSHAVGTTQEMTLYAEGPCSSDEMTNVKLDIGIQHCPPGFQLPQAQTSCVCAQRLQHYTDVCFVDNGTVLRKPSAEFWVGYNDEKGLILHSHCPFDYCTSEEAYLEVTNSDKQCNNDRSGLLCGRCSESLSLVLGSSRCLQCSNSYLSLLAAFAVAGIALVVLLLLLKLTVATGTINGLIFYANIVTMNSATLFRPKTTNVLTVFIAWLNLDLGIETCLYNGMEAYVKTWLQFAFPVYVWCLVITIIVCCRYSLRLVKLLGRNPIAVLATLFLLSYAKLLCTAIAALSYTTLEYPNSQSAVWLYDGNIEYLSSKHIPLFIAAIGCLIFLFLPYTALLIAGQWLQAKSNWRVFSWMNNRYVVSFLDAYHAPYSTKRRYWFGLMLLLRFVLFLIFAVNVLGDPRINLLSVGSALTFVIPSILTGTGTYRSLCFGLLELSFLINLAILVLATLYIYPNEANQNAVTFTSISIAFATFSGIVIYHAIQQIKATQLWRKLFVRRDFVPVPLDDEGELEEDPPERVYVPGCAPTQTVVDLRELRKECEATDIQEPCKAAEPHSGADVQEPSMEIHPQDPQETTELLEQVEPLELQEEPLDLIGLREPLEPIELQETLEPADLQALLESNEAAQLQGSAEQLETAELQEQVESAEPLEATEVQELRELIQLREPLLEQCEAVEAVKPQKCWGSTELQPLEPTGPLEAMALWKAVEAVPLQGSWESAEPIQEPLEATELREPLLESIELQEPLNATELLEPLKATELQEPPECTELQALQRGTELRESREDTELQELWMAAEAAHDLHQSANVQQP